RRMPKMHLSPNENSYGASVSALASCGRWVGAAALLEEMQHCRLLQSLPAFSASLVGASESSAPWQRSLALAAVAIRSGALDAVAACAVASVFIQMGLWHTSLSLLCCLRKLEVVVDGFSRNAAVAAAARCGAWEEAVALAAGCGTVADMVAYASICAALAPLGRWASALAYLTASSPRECGDLLVFWRLDVSQLAVNAAITAAQNGQ
ncbi:unnamed protein product, partial [Symbiodinium sp. KB8]